MAITNSESDNSPAGQNCPTAGLVVGLNQRLDMIKKEVLGAKDLRRVIKIIPHAETNDDCLLVLVRIYLIFREKNGRNLAERKIVRLVMKKEIQKRIHGLLNFNL